MVLFGSTISKERCDFGLDTLPAFEGQGLATACSHAAVSEALRHNFLIEALFSNRLNVETL